MQNSLKLTLDIYWTQEFKTKKDKTWLVGLNNYRNWHYHTSSKWKQDFHQLVIDQLPDNLPTFTRYTINYKLYYKRSCDGSNIVPLIEKVILDTLQEQGILTNDTVNYHLGSSWEVVEQDVDNPRCEIEIKEI